MNKKTLHDINFKDKKVIVRCDFNVPMDDNQRITDDNRIKSSLPTIEYLIKNNAKVILISHLGRPGGKSDNKYSLEPVAKRLSELLNKDVKFLQSDNVLSDSVEKDVEAMNAGDIVLLENTRFRSEETENSGDFAEELASLADIFVNDAFGTSHRSHSSNVGIASILPSCVGFLVEKELKIMKETLDNPKSPFIAILGGAKVSDKIGVIENLLDKVDSILIGGGMAYTFLKAKGYNIGRSLVEEDKLDLAKEILLKSKEKNVEIILPIDVRATTEFRDDGDILMVDIDNIPKNMMGLDIGDMTIEIFKDRIKKAKTIVWNGPMGVFEFDNFKKGTYEIARAIAESNSISIVGGGDSALAVENAGYKDKMTHVSTGGGASLELLEGRDLPGIECISDK